MPELSSNIYSETDGSNNQSAPNGMPEGMPPSGVNDAWRAGWGALLRFWGRIQGKYASTGSANAYVLTPAIALAAYVTGERYSFRSNFANTGAASLNISSLGAKTIKKMGAAGKTDLASGDIQNGQPVTVEYDGTDLVMTTPVATVGFLGGTLTSTTAMSGAAFNETFATIASAATTDIGAAAANYLQVTGTTAITGLGTVQAGTERTLEFSGVLTFTHNSASLILPGGVSITTAAGDVAIVRSEGSGNWRCISYVRNPSLPATKSVMQAGTDNVLMATAARVNDHDGVAKTAVFFNASGAIQGTSENVSGVVKNSTGNYTVNFTTAFANANYIAMITPDNAGLGGGAYGCFTSARGTGAVTVQIWNMVANTATDPGNGVNVVCFGRQ